MEEVITITKADLDKLSKYFTWVPPGHYYSPIPDKRFVKEREHIIFAPEKENFGIDFNKKSQLKLLDKLSSFLKNSPFSEKQNDKFRYYFDNGWFPKDDGLLLYSLLRYLKPKNIVEIGSGFSSGVMLDTRDLYLSKDTSITFVDPNPYRLKRVLKKNEENIILHEVLVQDIDKKIFFELQYNDILFIDSSHVSKVGSEVNYLFFEILPNLKKGVVIHFHDVFDNFEYPLSWIMEGRSWNESYLLKAFLQYNNFFKIILFPSYLEHCKEISKSPYVFKETSGSIWLRKVK